MRMASNTLYALATKTEGFTRLGFVGDLDLGYRVESGDFNFPTQCRGGEADWHFAMQVILFTLEDGVWLEMNLYVQIPRRATINPVFSFSGETDTVTFVHS